MMDNEISTRREPVIDPNMIQALEQLLQGRKELQANVVFSQHELEALRIPLRDFEAKVVAPRIAGNLAHHLSRALIQNALMSSVTDERRHACTEYRTRLAFLTEQEWTMLHKIKNTLAAEFGYPHDYR